jgi:hypothetical protein
VLLALLKVHLKACRNAENFLASLDVYNSEPFSKNRTDMQLPKVDLAQDSGISRAAKIYAYAKPIVGSRI